MEKTITKQYLIDHPDHIFVFGDNTFRKGKGGATSLRGMSNTYGFITKIEPDNRATSFYGPSQYSRIFKYELLKLKKFIEDNPQKTFLISKLGSGLANKYKIWEKVIESGIEEIRSFPNVIFLWKS